MAIPGTPTNFNIQQGNGQVFASWSISAGALTYSVSRSTDGVTYSEVATPATNYYLDTSVTVGTNYYYKVASTNASGTSPYTTAQSVVPTLSATMSLGQVRVLSQQRADRQNSNFVTLPEWNSYINQSRFELYDLLVTLYEDYYLAPPLSFTTDGASTQYSLPNGSNYSNAPAFYKMLGVDLGLNSNANAWVTLKKFDFASRNRYVYPNAASTQYGAFNLRYRIVGDTLMFIPAPSPNQTIQLWYIPRLTELLQDTDIMDGVSGWTEYVIVDAAIKALQKEESDVSVLMAQKQALIKRIEESAMNRDAGEPDTISDSRNWLSGFGENDPGFDGSFGGF